MKIPDDVKQMTNTQLIKDLESTAEEMKSLARTDNVSFLEYVSELIDLLGIYKDSLMSRIE